jgi:hypothetical protein
MLIIIVLKPFVLPLEQITNIKLHYKRVTQNTSKHLWIAKIYCNNTNNNQYLKCKENNTTTFD